LITHIDKYAIKHNTMQRKNNKSTGAAVKQ